MKIERIKSNTTNRVTLFEGEKKFLVTGNVELDNASKLTKIDLNVDNPNDQWYELKHANTCYEHIESGIKAHVLELHFEQKKLPHTHSNSVKIDKEYILDKGSFIFVTAIFYTNIANFKKCHYSIFDGQPETKDGAIIVSI
ncbi:hypothetical protein U8527_16295 [Kordia algicida OT-1]|uniref:Uncharacterized protein n=1 Tax=Kordia algicida OT-1 TaxID=391587 RepID=A9ECG9_9FLAO|nr:hypothetical protein [Kordia algicida]EDP94363.1 hypothetical protein KAOT1_09951 [Kordia algicida OT-1]